MSKTIALTISERVAALKIFDAFKGSLSTLATLLDDVKQFNITEDEWTAANLVKTPNPDGSVNWKWDDTDAPKEITVDNATADYLAAEIKRKSEAGEATLADISLISLEKKLA